jgi:ABC-2 type transport system permease protein
MSWRWVIVPVLVLVGGTRIWLRYRRRHPRRGAPRALSSHAVLHGKVGLVASREIRERLRGRLFRVSSAIILIVVAGAILIPKITSSPAPPEKVGVVGALATPERQLVVAVGEDTGTKVVFSSEASTAAAGRALRAGTIDVCIDGDRLIVDESSPSGDTFVQGLAEELGVQLAYQQAKLSPVQAETVARAKPFEVVNLKAATKTTVRTTSLVGVILIFIMLSQYLTWTLMGVMEEKSSRVVEVLLAAMRPIELLSGKVLGIGLMAMGQAALAVGFALVLAEAVGSSLLHGTAPVELAAVLVWLVLGYAFYCWVYAAAGSLVERQDQVQTLVLPLSIPMIVGYIFALIVAPTGSPSTFFDVLAYVPLTAPFEMPVLVALGRVQWWEFAGSAMVSIVCTFFVARFAAGIYRRAILRTGGRVRLRQLLAGTKG